MKQLSMLIVLLSISSLVGCSSNNITPKTAELNHPEETSQIEETDAFVKLVEENLSALYKVEKETTGKGYNERGKGSIAMYFQGDYVIKMEENVEVNDTIYIEEHYLYDVKPIYYTQKITYPNGKIENNKIYLQEWQITHFYQDGQPITDAVKIQEKQKELTTNFNRFR